MDEDAKQEDLDQLKERIVDAYRTVYDKSVAYEKNFVTDEERRALEADQCFQERLRFVLLEEREQVYNALRNLAFTAENEPTRLKALIEIGKIIYPEKFVEGYEEGKPRNLGKLDVNHNFKLDGSEQAAEILRILHENGGFKSAVKGDT